MHSESEGDRRVGKRRHTNTPAWADPGGAWPVIDCRILDITPEGARVSSASGRELPDVFQLRADSTRVIGVVEVVWRQANQVGVRFVERA
jgi:hypothetical protein